MKKCLKVILAVLVCGGLVVTPPAAGQESQDEGEAQRAPVTAPRPVKRVPTTKPAKQAEPAAQPAKTPKATPAPKAPRKVARKAAPVEQCAGVKLTQARQSFGSSFSFSGPDGTFLCSFADEFDVEFVGVLAGSSLQFPSFARTAGAQTMQIGKDAVVFIDSSGTPWASVLVEGGRTVHATAATADRATRLAVLFVDRMTRLTPAKRLSLSRGKCRTPKGALQAKTLAPLFGAVSIQFINETGPGVGECIIRSESAEIDVAVYNRSRTFAAAQTDLLQRGWSPIRSGALAGMAAEIDRPGDGSYFVWLSSKRYGEIIIRSFYAGGRRAGTPARSPRDRQLTRARTLASKLSK